MKKFFIPLTFLLLALIITVFVGLWWKRSSSPVSSDTSEVEFLILRGRSAAQIAQELYSQGLIKSPLAFKIYVQVKGSAENIQAGRYSLSRNLSITEVASQLIRGPKDVWVTIPEGLRREEVVERFIGGLEKEGQEAIVFRQEFLVASNNHEGFLFPDTYLFPRETKAATVVSAMRNTFDKRVAEIEEAKASDLSLEEIVILASIIERETKTDAERPVVAGILLNRLEIGMALQADATVQYALASQECSKNAVQCSWWTILSKDDLQIDSPYNTYKYRGLPPAPIANPGLSSLKAAILSEETDYLYYLHDPDGNIHYAATLLGHNENIRKYLGR